VPKVEHCMRQRDEENGTFRKLSKNIFFFGKITADHCQRRRELRMRAIVSFRHGIGNDRAKPYYL